MGIGFSLHNQGKVTGVGHRNDTEMRRRLINPYPGVENVELIIVNIGEPHFPLEFWGEPEEKEAGKNEIDFALGQENEKQTVYWKVVCSIKLCLRLN